MTYEDWCILMNNLLGCIEIIEETTCDCVKSKLTEKLNLMHEMVGDNIEII